MKKLILLLSLCLCWRVYAQSPVEISFPKENMFALGSYYYPEQWDSSQWERDLKKMSEIGIRFSASGMHTLNADLARLVREGYITTEDARAYTNNGSDLEQYLSC